jgi:hypothetical protein
VQRWLPVGIELTDEGSGVWQVSVRPRAGREARAG